MEKLNLIDLSEDYTIIVRKRGQKVKVSINQGAGPIAKGKAVCSKRDTFDLEYGVSLALKRALAELNASINEHRQAEVGEWVVFNEDYSTELLRGERYLCIESIKGLMGGCRFGTPNVHICSLPEVYTILSSH